MLKEVLKNTEMSHAKILRDISKKYCEVFCKITATCSAIILKGALKKCDRFSVKLLNPAGIHLLKVTNGNTRTRCEMCSKLILKTPES